MPGTESGHRPPPSPVRTATWAATFLPRRSSGHVSTRPVKGKSTLSSVLFFKHETSSKAEFGGLVCLRNHDRPAGSLCEETERDWRHSFPRHSHSKLLLCLQMGALARYIYHSKIQNELQHKSEVSAGGGAAVYGSPIPPPGWNATTHRFSQKPTTPASRLLLCFSLQLSREHKHTHMFEVDNSRCVHLGNRDRELIHPKVSSCPL